MPDMDIKRVVDRLVKKRKVIELVKLMQPLDVANVVAVDLELCPQDASRATLNLIKHAHSTRYEGLSAPSIEKSEYTIPNALDKSGEPLLSNPYNDEEIEESNAVLARPWGKDDITPKYVVKRWHFPPDPIDEPEGWPYDDMTKKSLEPGGKTPKRPLMMGKGKDGDEKVTVYTFRAFNPDMRQPGGDGAGGGGIYSKSAPHQRHNTLHKRGQSWDRKGVPGWSSSPKGQEFDLPGEEDKNENMGGMAKSVNPKPSNAGDEDDMPAFMKDPPVGASIPTTNFGGRTPVTGPTGHRAYRRR